ncbi:hypothetical protein KVV02_000564 [Mortierella alpina]|uniref:Uncharacterized protein n=1 Tax=Mortierella alpina TaxID=64518 RepID=A0A9P7ZZ87_MORAP|nr:hypothetical protein KVV02_000564 [Mortierella alpina]
MAQRPFNAWLVDESPFPEDEAIDNQRFFDRRTSKKCRGDGKVPQSHAETSAEQFQDLEQSLLPLAHSAHQFALVAQNMATPHDLLIAAQQAQPAINASKAQYVTVMKELERFAPIGQDLKTRLLEAAIAYPSWSRWYRSLPTQFINHPPGQAQIHSQVSAQVAEDFAQHFTTSLSALRAETEEEEADLEGYGDNAIIQFFHLNRTRPQNKRWSYFPRPHLDDRDLSLKNDSLVKALRHRSSPVNSAMATLFEHDKELVFRLFVEPTWHSKTTMSVNNFKQDADGLRMQLEQQWRERKERKEAGTETEFGKPSDAVKP